MIYILLYTTADVYIYRRYVRQESVKALIPVTQTSDRLRPIQLVKGRETSSDAERDFLSPTSDGGGQK